MTTVATPRPRHHGTPAALDSADEPTTALHDGAPEQKGPDHTPHPAPQDEREPFLPGMDDIAWPIMNARSISLAEVKERAELLARFDQAYLVPTPIFAALTAHLTDPRRPQGPFRALTIDGRRWFRYHSVYYDTPDMRCFHEHRQGRRLRFKIRERIYQDSGERQFEIKLKGGRGETVKHRRPLTGHDTPLDPSSRNFLADALLTAYGIQAPTALSPSVTTDYQRATLVSDGERITCDARLRCDDVREGGAVRCDPGLVLVETKTTGHLTEADLFLHAHGVRPAVFTKYCGSLVALRPGLAGGRWRRAARRAFTGDAS
ncbi:polyphosphate polymerase domain-containing protein [Streptomyces sp. NPDC005953]|uniref:polyphosphate polymerase domain-containing protein n=1 Tax=Streptomyces sp. NPDC005953 TaxID=3156719 RepID=UPI0033D336A7